MGSRRRFTKEFKISVIREMDSGKPVAQICREHSLSAAVIYKWKRQNDQYPGKAFSGKGNKYTTEAQLAEKDRLIGKLFAENDLLKKALDSLKGILSEERGKWCK